MKLLPAFSLLLFPLLLAAQVRYNEPVFDDVAVTKNIVYGKNATIIAISQVGEAIPQPLTLDLYEPLGDTLSSRPLVIVIPGGNYLPSAQNGICQGSKNDSAVVEICQRLAKMGYVAAAIEYRLGWNPLSPQEIVRRLTYVQAMYRGTQDARTAIRYFKKTTAEDGNPYRIDNTRIVLWGESVGGQVALTAAYANSPADWFDPSLVAPPGWPFIQPDVDGDIWGTNTGIALAGNPVGFPAGDTLCYPNWTGYSADFQLCVSMRGTLLNLPWIDAGEVPAILFHAPDDGIFPCGDGLMVLPPINLNIVDLSGSCSLSAQLESKGNNQVFWDANINDCVTNNAYQLNGNREGFYPFVGVSPLQGNPWEWTGPCPGNPNPALDGAFARHYLDTIMAYFAPRACAALNLCNASVSDLCGTQVKGKVFLDDNQNGILDAGEQPFPGIVLEVQPGGQHGASGFSGNYSISAPPGAYTLNVPSPPNYYAPTNTPVNVTVPTGADVFQNVGLHANATANDLQVTLTFLTDAKPGFANQFFIEWKNIGTTQLSGNVELTVDAQYEITASAPMATIAGNVATWAFSNLAPLQSGSAWLHATLPPDIQLGTLLTSTVVATPTGVTDETPANNTAVATQTVVGAFDPNDKRVTPAGPVTEAVLAAKGNWLDYTVRFQNTGTAPAINVFLVDTLSNLLNINTIEVLDASHPMRWELTGQGTLTWYFDNINLPDSLHDEPASHGFVRYRIQPKLPFAGLVGKTVYNFADIYFDFNAPVRTNTTATPMVASSGTGAPNEAGLLRVAPNPVGDWAVVQWPEKYFPASVSLQVYNAVGQLVFAQELPDAGAVSRQKIEVKNWSKGLYFIQLRSGAKVVSGQFVKE